MPLPFLAAAWKNLICIQILDLIAMAQIGVDIIGESHNHKNTIDNGNDIHCLGADIGQKYHDGQTRKQNCGANLTRNQSACQHAALSVSDQTCKELETFLDDKKDHKMQ